MKKHAYWLYFLLVLVTSCSTEEKPVTKEEALDFAKKLEASVVEKNPNVFNEIFDGETFKKRIRAASNNKISDKGVSEIPSALKKRRLGDEILQTIGKEGMYQLVRNYEKEGKQHVIFRLFGDGGLNYQDIELVHSGKEIKAADIYLYLTGENLSKSLADIFLQLEAYSKNNKDIKEVGNSAAEIKKYMARENYEKAFSLFETLPDTLKKQRMFQILRLQIAANLDDDKYTNALDEYEKLYPGEAGMYITLLDVHFLKQEYDKALEDVNKMDSIIHGDPFLDFYRGLLFKVKDDDRTAVTYFERLYKNMPAYARGIIELIGAYSRLGEKEKVKEMIKVYKSNKKFKQEDISVYYILYPELEK